MNINIEIPEDIHKRIKILSAMQGTPLKDLIVKTLEESINEKNK